MDYDIWQVIYTNNPLFLSKFLFLGVFAQFQNAAITFVMSVRLSVPQAPPNKSAALEGFYEDLYLKIFRKYVEKIQM
jgi:hypothetical protein